MDFVRPSNLDRAHVRVIHVYLIVCDDSAPLQRLRKALRLPQFPDERHADDPRTCLNRDADLQLRRRR